MVDLAVEPAHPDRADGEDPARSAEVDSVHRAFLDKLHFEQAKFKEVATPNDHYLALAHAVRDRLMARWVEAAPSPPGARLRDQPSLPPRGGGQVSERPRPDAAPVSDQREWGEGSAYGARGGGGQSCHQRSRADAFGLVARHRATGFRGAVPRALFQRHEWRDAAAVPGAGQSDVDTTYHQRDWRRLADLPGATP